MYAILGEHPSDAQTLKILVRRRLNLGNTKIFTKGYGGCGELLRKGANQLKAYSDLGATRFLVCHDADGPAHMEVHERVNEKIVKPCGLSNCCIVVPIQELEAWILADISAVSKVIPSWRNPKPVGNPESVISPKEHLERLSSQARNKPLYDHVQHNERVAEHLDLDKLRAKCPSFKRLDDWLSLH